MWALLETFDVDVNTVSFEAVGDFRGGSCVRRRIPFKKCKHVFDHTRFTL